MEFSIKMWTYLTNTQVLLRKRICAVASCLRFQQRNEVVSYLDLSRRSYWTSSCAMVNAHIALVILLALKWSDAPNHNKKLLLIQTEKHFWRFENAEPEGRVSWGNCWQDSARGHLTSVRQSWRPLVASQKTLKQEQYLPVTWHLWLASRGTAPSLLRAVPTSWRQHRRMYGKCLGFSVLFSHIALLENGNIRQ